MRFSPIVYPIMALSLAAVAGCSSSPGNDDTGVNGTCSTTLSGAVNGTYACSAAVAAYATASATSTIAFAVTLPAVSVAITVPGQFGTNTYTNVTSGASGGVTLTSGSTVYYAVVSGGTSTGTFTLHLTSVSTIGSVSTGTTYTVHGTLTGTLAPAGGTGSSVAISSTF